MSANTANRDENGHLCNIVAISAGTTHSLALTASGVVYAWGNASVGQLGQGRSGLTVSAPGRNRQNTHKGLAAAQLTVSPAFRHKNSIVPMIQNAVAGVHAQLAHTVVAPAIHSAVGGKGSDFSMALTKDGTVYAWGDNQNGQLGTVSTVNEAILKNQNRQK